MTIFWVGSNADFYAIYGVYSWRDALYNYHYDYLDTFVAADSVIFEGSRFAHDGGIYISGIDPVNGPIPEPGTPGNMYGSGTGYLYYTNSSQASLYKYVVVGGGYPPWAKPAPIDPCEMFSKSEMQARIARGLGLVKD